MNEFHQKIIEILEEKKACQIKLIDMEQKSDICSYQLICSGLNERHTQALSTALETELKASFKESPSVVEGKALGSWILLDYQSTIIHIFVQDVRSYYAFDALCTDKKVVFESES